jgi:ketosteroid isomerase-like protein
MKLRGNAMNIRLLYIAFGTFAAVVCQPLYAGEQNSVCPKHPKARSDAEMLQAHVAAFEAGNAELIACDYAKDAVLILPGAVAQGPASIQSAFAGFFDLAGANIGVVNHSLTLADGVALFEYSVTSDRVEITDGVDSFVIKNGLIVAHTARLGGLSVK